MMLETERMTTHSDITGSPSSRHSIKNLRKPSSLQVKLAKSSYREQVLESQKQREAVRNPHRQASTPSPVESQPRRSILVTRERLAVPWKASALEKEPSEQPLVSIDSESEDEFDIVALSSTPSQTTQDLRQQLLKDGFRLDEVPDDEELDLIPPRPMTDRCVCCQTQANCTIQ
ncbi:protein FAM219A-like isoform X3 [Diadema antillarum]|uniref:protein FAM219A-like isoform X3 n=1 Tax=Diadema antillarum TaxID=105358 RepID=UPI003A89516A